MGEVVLFLLLVISCFIIAFGIVLIAGLRRKIMRLTRLEDKHVKDIAYWQNQATYRLSQQNQPFPETFSSFSTRPFYSGSSTPIITSYPMNPTSLGAWTNTFGERGEDGHGIYGGRGGAGGSGATIVVDSEYFGTQYEDK